MLLTKEQQKFITKTLNSIAIQVKDKKEEELRVTVEMGNVFAKGIHAGKLIAYKECFDIAKTAAEESYEAEYDGADKKLLDIATKLEAQAEALEQAANNFETQINLSDGQVFKNPKATTMLDQAYLLKNMAIDIKLILRQVEK